EGFGGNIDAFLEQIGVWIWEKNSMRYPSHGPLSHILSDKEMIIDFPLTAQFKDGRKLKSHFTNTHDTSHVSHTMPNSKPMDSWNVAEYAVNRTLIGNTAEKVWRMY